jgi:hypothetical protein
MKAAPQVPMTPGRGTPESAQSRGHSQRRMLSLAAKENCRRSRCARRLASARLRIIGLRKCLVPETVTVSLPGPDPANRWDKIKVSGRLRGK